MTKTVSQSRPGETLPSALRRPPRILHVSTTINRGGHENHLVDLIEVQVARGLIVRCAYLKHQPYWAPRLAALGVESTPLHLKHMGAIGPAMRLRRLIAEFRPDILHAHGTQAEIYAYAATRLMRDRPLLVITRHEERMRFFRIPGFAVVDRLLTAGAARFIAISHAIKRVDELRSPATGAKMDVVHYGYCPPQEQPDERRLKAAALRADWQVPPQAVLLVTVARLAEEKSIDTLLNGFAKYLRDHPEADDRLAIVGRGPLEAQLKSLAEELGLGHKVIWAGFREDVTVVLEACDIFVLTSILEGFGMVLLEAMAAGRPIIASHVSAIPEIVSDSETGLLFPARDSDALANRIAMLSGDAQLRERLSRAAGKRLEEHFPLDKMVQRTTEIYCELLGEARSPDVVARDQVRRNQDAEGQANQH